MFTFISIFELRPSRITLTFLYQKFQESIVKSSIESIKYSQYQPNVSAIQNSSKNVLNWYVHLSISITQLSRLQLSKHVTFKYPQYQTIQPRHPKLTRKPVQTNAYTYSLPSRDFRNYYYLNTLIDTVVLPFETLWGVSGNRKNC